MALRFRRTNLAVNEEASRIGALANTGWLDGDVIATSAWTVPIGLTMASSNNTPATATVWLSGGTAGQTYTVTNRITTTGGRTENRSLEIRVLER